MSGVSTVVFFRVMLYDCIYEIFFNDNFDCWNHDAFWVYSWRKQ